ncbi:MAG: hypothetical protein R2867_42975 [Caldilineaceae bacterium]
MHRFGGSVIAFAGDAITPVGCRMMTVGATACARSIQNAIQPFATVSLRRRHRLWQ